MLCHIRHFIVHKVNLSFRYNSNSARISFHPQHHPKLFRHFPLAVCYVAEVSFYPEKLDTACWALCFVRIASSPLPLPPSTSTPSQPSQLSLARPVSTPFPPVLTLPLSSPLFSPIHPSELTFLTKSEITFVTRNSARPNPCIELALSFYF